MAKSMPQIDHRGDGHQGRQNGRWKGEKSTPPSELGEHVRVATQLLFGNSAISTAPLLSCLNASKACWRRMFSWCVRARWVANFIAELRRARARPMENVVALASRRASTVRRLILLAPSSPAPVPCCRPIRAENYFLIRIGIADDFKRHRKRY